MVSKKILFISVGAVIGTSGVGTGIYFFIKAIQKQDDESSKIKSTSKDKKLVKQIQKKDFELKINATDKQRIQVLDSLSKLEGLSNIKITLTNQYQESKMFEFTKAISKINIQEMQSFVDKQPGYDEKHPYVIDFSKMKFREWDDKFRSQFKDKASKLRKFSYSKENMLYLKLIGFKIEYLDTSGKVISNEVAKTMRSYSFKLSKESKNQIFKIKKSVFSSLQMNANLMKSFNDFWKNNFAPEEFVSASEKIKNFYKVKSGLSNIQKKLQSIFIPSNRVSSNYRGDTYNFKSEDIIKAQLKIGKIKTLDRGYLYFIYDKQDLTLAKSQITTKFAERDLNWEVDSSKTEGIYFKVITPRNDNTQIKSIDFQYMNTKDIKVENINYDSRYKIELNKFAKSTRFRVSKYNQIDLILKLDNKNVIKFSKNKFAKVYWEGQGSKLKKLINDSTVTIDEQKTKEIEEILNVSRKIFNNLKYKINVDSLASIASLRSLATKLTQDQTHMQTMDGKSYWIGKGSNLTELLIEKVDSKSINIASIDDKKIYRVKLDTTDSLRYTKFTDFSQKKRNKIIDGKKYWEGTGKQLKDLFIIVIEKKRYIPSLLPIPKLNELDNNKIYKIKIDEPTFRALGLSTINVREKKLKPKTISSGSPFRPIKHWIGLGKEFKDIFSS